MTLRIYADRKKWPLEEAVVPLRHTKIHAEDEERCESAEARLDRIERELELVGPLDQGQRARLLEIAERCPVHRTLSAGIQIETELAHGPGAGAEAEWTSVHGSCGRSREGRDRKEPHCGLRVGLCRARGRRSLNGGPRATREPPTPVAGFYNRTPTRERPCHNPVRCSAKARSRAAARCPVSLLGWWSS